MTKRLVRSWDVFDTLIARRCGTHDEIFEIMGKTLGPDFRITRSRAEIVARKSKYEITIEDIYNEIQIEKGWTTQERKSALELEIRTEFSQVIPIAENMSLVRDGDVLVSDMYLPHDVILGLLREAGLDKLVKLFVSTCGKVDGMIWKSVKANHIIVKHIGDHPRSDFINPILHFVPAGLTIASAETPWECMLRANGAPELSRYIREMRLRTSTKSAKIRALQTAQIEVNFPLLLLSSASLILYCRENNISRALMASRDCILWSALAQKVALRANKDLSIEYFLISRVAALKSSEHYLDYAARRITADSIVVDLSMTGISLAGLADRLCISEINAFVIALHQSVANSLYGGKFSPKAKIKFEYLLAELAHHDLEALNQASTPSIHDVNETTTELFVEYAAENRSTTVLQAVNIQNSMFHVLVDRKFQWQAAMYGDKVTYFCCVECKFVRTNWFDDYNESDFREKIYNKAYYTNVDPDYTSMRPAILSFSISCTAYVLGLYKILDYGGGNGVTSDKMNERWRGIIAKSFDPHGRKDDLSEFRPDLITMIEVIEHAVHPGDIIKQVNEFCGGSKPIIFLTTKLSGGDPNSKYIAPRNGHVSIFNKQSLNMLSKKFGYKCASIRNSHIFYVSGSFQVYFFLVLQEALKISYGIYLRVKQKA